MMERDLVSLALHQASHHSVKVIIKKSNKLTVVARIEAKPDKIALVKAELMKLIEPTLEEAGCVQYDLHQDNENPAVFLFYENWESREFCRRT